MAYLDRDPSGRLASLGAACLLGLLTLIAALPGVTLVTAVTAASRCLEETDLDERRRTFLRVYRATCVRGAAISVLVALLGCAGYLNAFVLAAGSAGLRAAVTHVAGLLLLAVAATALPLTALLLRSNAVGIVGALRGAAVAAALCPARSAACGGLAAATAISLFVLPPIALPLMGALVTAVSRYEDALHARLTAVATEVTAHAVARPSESNPTTSTSTTA